MEKNIYNLVNILDESSAKFPKKTALVFGAKKVKYIELSSKTKKFASALYDLGVREFDKVAIWLPNCPEYIYSFFAILRLKATVVPMNTMIKREEARYMAEDSLSKVLICSIDKLEDSKSILSRADNLSHLIVLTAPEDDDSIIDFNKSISKSEEYRESLDINDDDLAEIVYTSGTTGKPKGACLSHKNIFSNIKDCSNTANFRKNDSFLCILPLFHSFSSTVCMMLPLYLGSTIVIMRSVRPFKRVIRTIMKNKVTIFMGVPSIFNILAAAKLPFIKRFINILINPVRFYISGAAALPNSVIKKFEKKFKRPLIQGYGLTEASPVVSLNPLNKTRKIGSVGKALKSIEVKVINKEGNFLPSGEIGELLVKGPNVMRKYYNLEKETEDTLKYGWLFTGDLAKIDEDGNIYIMGRIKEMINVRGFNVYPREIEDIIYSIPKVKEVAVVGVSHRHRGEAPVAFVVKENNLDEKELMRHLKSNLAAYKLPLKIIFKEKLPKNATGKILKRLLKNEIKGIFK